MIVIIWIAEGTWPACVDAARRITPADADITLLHVTGGEAPTAHGAYAGLLGRGRPGRDPARQVARLGEASGREMLEAAAARLGRPCARAQRRGRAEREVVAAAAGADLLVLARDGEAARLGPHSLGPASRFVVDHASCPVLLVWPGGAPAGPLPPAPPRPPLPPRP